MSLNRTGGYNCLPADQRITTYTMNPAVDITPVAAAAVVDAART